MPVPPCPRERSRVPRTVLLLSCAATALAVSGCSSSSPGTVEQPYALAGAGTTVGAGTTTAGSVLTDHEGRVLYALFPAGDAPAAPCTGECAVQWPAYAADGVPHPENPALNPLRTDQLGTIPAPGGVEQVAYAGRGLHRFIGDPVPGMLTGQGIEAFGGTWYPVNPNGDPVRQAAVAD